MDKDTANAIDWLNEIISNPGEWKRFYSDSEAKNLAECALKLIEDLNGKCVENNSEESYFPFKEKDAQSGWTLFYCGKCRKPFWRTDANYCEICGAKVKK